MKAEFGVVNAEYSQGMLVSVNNTFLDRDTGDMRSVWSWDDGKFH